MSENVTVAGANIVRDLYPSMDECWRIFDRQVTAELLLHCKCGRDKQSNKMSCQTCFRKWDIEHNAEVYEQLLREDCKLAWRCMVWMYVAACIATVVAFATGWTING